MNNVRYRAWCCFGLLFAWLVFAPAAILEAASLHAILVADTLDPTIGKETDIDIQKMRTTFKEVANQTDLSFNLVQVAGKETSPSKLLSRLDKLKISPEDVVVFFYSGHGYRTPSKGDGNPWPNLAFSQSDKGVDFDFVAQKLIMRNPRLIIAIADVCNNIIPDEFAPRLVRKMMAKPVDNSKITENYQELFLNNNGVIQIASSQPGEYSWATRNGSLYTLSFLQELSLETQTSGIANWQDLLGRAITSLDGAQHPVYQINLN